MKLLLDEMYSPAVAASLRDRGHDVLSLHDPAFPLPSGAPDAEVLLAAEVAGRTLVTENVRDFRLLEADVLARGAHHAGLIYTTDRQFPRGQPGTVGRLVLALETMLRSIQAMRDRTVVLRAADA